MAKLVLLSTGCASALAFSGSAFAQTAPATADAPGEIVVTGFRSSLKTAQDAKRKDIRVTDGISSEDIGKFPAENITEAIQRIAGVQMSNINGRGSTISIRGLGAQYARTTINGQTFASADFKDGFRYDIIQTDMASAIEVVKSPTADMDSGGLSGTVNIETIHPVNYKGPRFTLTAKGYDNLYRGGVTPKIGGAYVDRFLDDTLSVFVNVGYQKLQDRGDYLFNDRYTTATYQGSTVTVPNRLRYRRIDRNTEQLMGSGAVEYRPNDKLDVLLQAEYSRDHTTYDTEQLVFGKFSNGTGLTVNHATAGVADNISVSNYTMDNNDQLETRNLQTQAYTLTTNWTPADDWKVHAVGHYTVGTAHLYEWASIDEVNMGAATLNMQDPSNVSFTTSSLTSGSQYTTANRTWFAFVDGAYHHQTSKDAAAQLDVTKDFHGSFLKNVTLGAKFHHESANTAAYRHDRDGDVSDPVTYPEYAWVPSITSTGKLVSNFLDGAMSIPHSFLAVNAATWQNTLTQHNINVPVTDDPANSYRVDRYVPSAYLMANIDTTLFGKSLRGNIGARYEHTHQNVTSNIVNGDNVRLGITHTVQDYSNVLPSLNLALDLDKHLVARVAAAKVLVRPLLNSNTNMADTVSTGVSSGNRAYTSVAYGEQLLKPLTANQVDVSVEYYWGKGNAITLAGFYKAIKNGTYTQYFCPSSYNGVALAGTAQNCTSANGAADYSFSRVLNDASTINLRGLELGVSQSFDAFLPVKGFGVTGNLTVVDPDSVTLGNGFHLKNLSKVTWNITPYWENKQFNLRLAINHRSSYEQDYADSFFAGYGSTHVVRNRTQLDLSAGYTMNKMLSFNAGVINLNNSHEDAYYQDPRVFQMASRTGRNIYFGATAKF